MKTKLNLFQGGLFCAMALAIGPAVGLAAAAEGSPAKTSQVIPWSQIGTKAGADYQGDGLAVVPTGEGARLRCVFQRLEGEATREGLWLSSTVTNAASDRFCVMAVEVGRQSSMAGKGATSLASNAHIQPEPAKERMGKRRTTAALQSLQ